MQPIRWIKNQTTPVQSCWTQRFDRQQITLAHTLHKSFPQYTLTPLAGLQGLAKRLGLGGVYVKDESQRFGLNSFKVLGSSFAMASYIAQKLGRNVAELSCQVLTSPELREEFGQATFFTATDGNHGRAVAWAAAQLGQKAVVLMPKGSSPARFENIRKEGAEVSIQEANYDECVRMAAALAAEAKNGVVVQDTAWPGYEDIPLWIMQGYAGMALEAQQQLEALGTPNPTHLFIQAGVGSMAGAAAGYFAAMFPQSCPVTVVMEPETADCFYRSASRAEGDIQMVGGDMPTIMAGLACGEPNPIAWDILRSHASYFTACPDWVTAKGMRTLAAPLPGDPRVISGESGAVGVGLLASIMEDESYADLRGTLGLDESSVVLIFSTEGDTDPEHYRRIVWDGKYPSCS